MTEMYKDNFMKCFVELYSSIHRFETAKIRNSAKFYAHLFYTDSIDWRIFACITLTQDTTTASSRIFIKNLVLEVPPFLPFPSSTTPWNSTAKDLREHRTRRSSKTIQQRRTSRILRRNVPKRPSTKHKIRYKLLHFHRFRCSYRKSQRTSETVDLRNVKNTTRTAVENAIRKRRSRRFKR